MAGSLSKFATTIRTRGVAKASKYKIKFSLPPMMQQFANRAETIELMAEATQFPEFSLLTQRIVDDGIGREVAYDKRGRMSDGCSVCRAQRLSNRRYLPNQRRAGKR
jgi:hypothetical protein